jgi:hypothetical protein
MRRYLIAYPHLSKGLKIVYNKKLEVIGGVFNKESFVADTLYSYKKGVWIKKPAKNYSSDSFSNIISGNDLSVLKDNRWIYGIVFPSLDLAKTAKLLAIQNISIRQAQELIRLQQLYADSLPDFKAPLAEMYDKYPEYFV